MENEHVHNVYNLIYNKFDKTRTYGLSPYNKISSIITGISLCIK